MHLKDVVFYFEPDLVYVRKTNHTCPDVGIFTIHGFTAGKNLDPHPMVLTGIRFDGHALRVNIGYGDTKRFTIENISDPASGATFSYKHSGQMKKKFKPGDIISPPETHVLLWDSLDLQGHPVTVILTLIPLPAQNALRVHYTLSPKK